MAQSIAKLWRALAKHSKSTSIAARIVAQPGFHRALARERVRADRSQLPLSILVIELPADRQTERDIVFLSQVFERRLRLTDIAGFFDDRRVAVLLPDTSKAGAWKVASDICDLYPVGHERPNCDVYIYADATEGVTDEQIQLGAQASDSSFAPLDSLFALPTVATLVGKQEQG
jgi:hypothetical protein